MNKLYVLILLLLTSCHFKTSKDDGEYDVVIYGGSPGGVTAAIQVAKMGKTAALVVPYDHVGGILVNGCGNTDIDGQKHFQNSIVVGGLALEYYKRIAKTYNREKEFDLAIQNGEKNHSLWTHEPHVAEQVIMDWLLEYGDKIDLIVDARLSEKIGSVTKSNRSISNIILEDGRKIKGKIFIDATLVGDLMNSAGISNFVGREANSKYNEKYNGVITNTTHAQFKFKIDPYKVKGDPTSGLIATIQPGEIGTNGEEDTVHYQAFCFRPVLSNIENNKISFRRPKNYQRSNYEIYIRYLENGGSLYSPWIALPNNKGELNAYHDLSHNLYGMNVGYIRGNYVTRERIEKEHRDFTEGLFYFLSTDSVIASLAPELQGRWQKWGLAKDEFVGNGNWPRQFYIREGRRMVSDYVITEHHVVEPNPLPVDDPVAVAYWPMDLHSARRIVVDHSAFNEGAIFRSDGPWNPLPISYKSLVPKANECTNFLTPTCPSSSNMAYGAIRIEWTFMALGQAVGTAAVLAIENNISVQDIKYDMLKRRLVSDNQILSIDRKI